MTRSASIFVTIVLLAAGGCSGGPRLHQEIALKALIHRAYKSDNAAAVNPQYGRHFERGWKQAYYNISKGADVCPPSTPPEEYWSVKYQTPEGCRKIAAWYEGYRCGAIAAQRDGRPQFATVPLSSLCYRPEATACQEVLELRSESVAVEAGEGGSEADTARLPAQQVNTDENINLSSYVPLEDGPSELIAGISSEQVQRLPPVESSAAPTN